MKIALVGFGKMGHMLKDVSLSHGHSVVITCDSIAKDADFISSDSEKIAQAVKNSGAEGIIEFSHPSAVLNNLNALIPTGIPLVVGTTGWHDKISSITKLVESANSSLLYSSNFSIGVNLFYKIVEEAAAIMNSFDEYDVASWELHHNQKADSPSGTALEIANRVLKNIDRKTTIVTDSFKRKPEPQEFHVASVRLGSVPGTHTVAFDSSADTIELTHTARNRGGFALGAVRALEWLVSPNKDNALKKGVFTMNDVMN